MGTSGRYSGGSSGIVPTWVDDPSEPVGSSPSLGGGGGGSADGGASAPGTGAPAQPAPSGAGSPAVGGSLRSARRSFNRFAKGDGRQHFGRAAGRYVRSGMGGSGNATGAMGSSRQVGGGLLTFARDFASVGPVEALRALNLEQLAQAPAEVVLPRLLEAICPPGGNVDEAIARQALLSAIAQLCENFDGPIAALSANQLKELFLDFVAFSIEGRVLNEIGTKLVDLPDSVSALEDLDKQVHDFVGNCVQNSIGPQLDDIAAIQDVDIRQTVESIYQATFDLIDTFAEEP